MATSGPPTKTPAEVPPGPGSTGKIPTTPVPIGPPETAPPPVPPGPGSGVVSDPDETPTLPTEELPVEAPVDGPVNIIPSSTAVFVKTELDNVTVIEKTTALNFSGNGVTVIGSGSQANIVITAGSGGNPGGSNTQLQFNDAGVLAGNASLTFNKVTALLSTTNISANNANISSNLFASGNVTGSYFIGNGSLLTGIAANYGNANVAANLAVFGSNPISTTGNITAGYVLGNGSQLTGLPATYGNANVAANLAAFGANPISATGNISGGNLFSGGFVSASGNLIGGNVLVTGIISATGDISSVANITGANLAAAGLASVTGNVTGGNLRTGGVVSATGNVISGNLTTVGQVSATGNITGNFFIGNGSLLTGISGGGGSYGNANVAANLAAFGSNPISTTGNVTAGNFVGGGAGTPTISSATNLDLSAVSAVRVIGGGTFRLPSLTTAQIANTIAANGDMIYNSSVNKFQGYENGAWANII